MRYFSELSPGKVILWCYLIWYLVITYFYFDPTVKLWMNSLGMSAVIGTGLILSVAAKPKQQIDPWQALRLYLMPFCVSSFSALTKDQGFVLVVPPHPLEGLIAGLGCLLFLVVTRIAKTIK